MTHESLSRRFARLLSAQSVAILERAAVRGDGDAACRLGDLYRLGSGGVRFSPAQAYRWYTRSALVGDANGQCNLGACYEHGIGCTQSYIKAVKWYRLSAAQAIGTASMNLGYCTLHGRAVRQDKGQALRLFRLAVEQGEARAQPEVERLEETMASPKVRIVYVTELGKHFGVVGARGLTRPECPGDGAGQSSKPIEGEA